MTLKIKYTHSCDFCKVEFKEEDYEIQVGPMWAVPQPVISDNGVGRYMACPSCNQIAIDALMKKVVNRD